MDDGWYLEAEATVGLLTATGSPRTSYRPLPSHAPADGGASRAAETARATLERLVEADESAVTALVDDLSEITADQPDLLVVVGDMALIEGTRRGLGETPILPVETTPSLQGVAVTDLEAAIAGLEGGSGRIRHQPTLTVESETASARAVFDVTVVTSEPARISEFCLQSRGRTVAQFRADGVIVASPAGSHGYAAAASGSAVGALDSCGVCRANRPVRHPHTSLGAPARRPDHHRRTRRGTRRCLCRPVRSGDGRPRWPGRYWEGPSTDAPRDTTERQSVPRTARVARDGSKQPFPALLDWKTGPHHRSITLEKF